MVSDALKRANATDRVLVAFDVNQDTLDGIKGGTIDATIAQKPYTMGWVGLKALDEIFHDPPKQLGKDYSVDSFSPYPVFVDTGTSLVDKATWISTWRLPRKETSNKAGARPSRGGLVRIANVNRVYFRRPRLCPAGG